jgi:glycosyltransferase involved in cell wall biosynthesis
VIRILHVDSERPWRGGQNQILLLMRRQRARGQEPHLAAPREAALLLRAAGEGFPVHPVAMRGTWDVASVLALAAILRSLEPEVVHWHAARAHAIGAMASCLHPRPARVLSRRVVFPVRRSIGSRLLYALPVDRIAAISGAVREALVRSGVDARKIDVVPSGVEPWPRPDGTRRAELRRRLGCGEGDVAAITVSALAPGKGLEHLLRATAVAAETAPGLRLWIAGEGPLHARLQAKARSLGLEPSVQFLGFRTDIQALLHAADFFCLATRSEGLGSSILEAMSAGLPVVATRVGGVPEIVEEGVTGVLVPASDPAALASAMARMAVDRGLRESMGARGRDRASHFSADRTAELTDRVYRAAREARGRRSAPGAG